MASIKVQELDNGIATKDLNSIFRKTELWIYEPDTPTAETGRLMNTITRTSDFVHIPKSRDHGKVEEREKTARELAEGWIANGNKHNCTFLIVHK